MISTSISVEETSSGPGSAVKDYVAREIMSGPGIACREEAVTDAMLAAAAGAIAALAPPASLLPSLSDVRSVSRNVALAVGIAAVGDGIAPSADEATLARQIASLVWEPQYHGIDFAV